MKFSVVVTVLNEEKTIKDLLDSLLSQTKTPNEIVIVDGGSIDKTTEVIKEYKQSHRIIKLVSEPGTIAHGRNIAVKNAKYKHIAQIDAGCKAKKDWLEKLIKPFEDKKVGLVAGFYEMVCYTNLQKAAAPFFGIPKERFDPRNYMPSGRSVAFKKKIWEKAGGYSEELQRAGEDTLFNYAVLKSGAKIARVKDAIVYWEVPSTLHECMKKFYYYAKGDAEAGIWWHPAQGLLTHNIKISLIYARYLVGLILFLMGLIEPLIFVFLIIGVVFYSFWSCWKMNDVITDTEVKLWIPVLQIGSDLAVMAGFATGTIGKK